MHLSLQVYCDTETDGGGWTVFQRRQDGSVNFYHNWVDYEEGFVNLIGEFWVGVSKIHHLIPDKANILQVDLGDFENKRLSFFLVFTNECIPLFIDYSR